MNTIKPANAIMIRNILKVETPNISSWFFRISIVRKANKNKFLIKMICALGVYPVTLIEKTGHILSLKAEL